MRVYTGKSRNHPAVYWKRYSARGAGSIAVLLTAALLVIMAVR